MGCSFSAIACPAEVKTPEEVKEYYRIVREELDGEYTGTLGSDNGEVVVHPEIELEIPSIENEIMSGTVLYDWEGTDEEEEIVEVLEKQTEAAKWGPSVAIRVNNQWVIAGFYSD